MKLNSNLLTDYKKISIGPFYSQSEEFPIERQIMSNWCWAAVTASIAKFYDDQLITQNSIVANVTNRSICASNVIQPSCNVTADLGEAIDSIGHLVESFEASINEEQIIYYISKRQPIGCQLYLPSLNGGHAVIIYGAYYDSSRNLILYVADPDGGQLLAMPLRQFSNDYKGIGGQWVRTYTTC